MSVKYFNKEKNEWVIFPGTIGAPGEDSYQIAVNHGYKGTYEEYQHMIAIMPDILMKATDYINNIDEVPTENSDHMVKSSGVYSSIKNVETLVNNKSSELNTKIDEAKSEIENNINPKLDELNDRITDVESDLNSSLDDLEKIVIDNKNDSDNSISDLEKSFDDKMQEVLDNLNNKANVSDIPNDYVTPDVIEGVYSAIDNIDTTVSAEEVATVLDADMIAGVVNGSLKIEGTAITDDAIATRHLIANSVSSTAIAAGAIIAEKIAAGAITADKIDAGAIKSEHIYGSALNGLTIEDGADKWKLNKDGSGYLASQNIKWDTDGKVTFGSDVTIAWSDEQTSLVDNAQNTANTANSTANNAKTTADSANTTAKSANSAAVEATRIANEAASTANSASTKAVDALNIVNSLNNGEKLAELLNGITDGTKKINGTAIANGAIASDLIAANAIVGGKIATGAITADKIKAGAITADKIAGQSLSGLTIDSGNNAWILRNDGSGHLANQSITWNKIGEMTVTADIQAKSISLTGDTVKLSANDNVVEFSLKRNNEYGAIGFRLNNNDSCIQIRCKGSNSGLAENWVDLEDYIYSVVEKKYNSENYSEEYIVTRYEVNYRSDNVINHTYSTVSSDYAASINISPALIPIYETWERGKTNGVSFDRYISEVAGNMITPTYQVSGGWTGGNSVSYAKTDAYHECFPNYVDISYMVDGSVVHSQRMYIRDNSINCAGGDSSNY